MVFKEEDRYCNYKLRQINAELALQCPGFILTTMAALITIVQLQ